MTSSFTLERGEASYGATDSLHKPGGCIPLADFSFYPNTEVGSSLPAQRAAP